MPELQPKTIIEVALNDKEVQIASAKLFSAAKAGNGNDKTPGYRSASAELDKAIHAAFMKQLEVEGFSYDKLSQELKNAIRTAELEVKGMIGADIGDRVYSGMSTEEPTAPRGPAGHRRSRAAQK